MRVLGTVYVNTISLSVVLGLFLSPKTANIVRTQLKWSIPTNLSPGLYFYKATVK